MRKIHQGPSWTNKFSAKQWKVPRRRFVLKHLICFRTLCTLQFFIMHRIIHFPQTMQNFSWSSFCNYVCSIFFTEICSWLIRNIIGENLIWRGRNFATDSVPCFCNLKLQDFPCFLLKLFESNASFLFVFASFLPHFLNLNFFMLK